jgi:citrate synthase
MTTNTGIAKGLEGIEVDETAISLVDGARGTLSYRGYPLETLVSWPFTRVALLVLDDKEPDAAEHEAFEDELTEHAALRPTETALLDLLAPTAAHPMQVLIALATTLEHDPRAFTRYGEAARGLSIAARLPAALAYLLAKRRGSVSPVTANSSGNPVTRYLNAIGAPSNATLARAMEVTQILQIEHGFNAGTFAARVVASTLAPVENSIAGAIAALHGILHGGADQAALETAHKVGSPAAASAFVDECLATGNKVMGMGHREYKVLDPRARYVKQFAIELSRGTPQENVAATLVAIEERFTQRMREKNKPLYANLEFYKGIVYSSAGLPPDFFTATFAMARVFGYIAHFMESRKDNRIIRPSARYVGRMPDSL